MEITCSHVPQRLPSPASGLVWINGCLLSHSPPHKTTMSFPGGALLYSQRPEWQDVTPLPQHESLSPLAPIFYTDECMARSMHIGVPN